MTAVAPRSRSVLGAAVAPFRSSTALGVGLAFIAVHLVLAVLAPVIAGHDPVATDAADVLAGPSWAHWLGTDQYGRDLLSRTLNGGRYALLVTFLATTIAVAVGSVLGCVTAYADNWFDEVVMRVVDALLSVPSILALLVVVTVFDAGLWVIVLAVTVVYAPAVTRVVRGAARTVITQDYVTAARARGERAVSIVFREILPNVLDVVLVEFAMRASLDRPARRVAVLPRLRGEPTDARLGAHGAGEPDGADRGAARHPRADRGAGDARRRPQPRRRRAGQVARRRPRTAGSGRMTDQQTVHRPQSGEPEQRPLVRVEDLAVSYAAGRRTVPVVRGVSSASPLVARSAVGESSSGSGIHRGPHPARTPGARGRARLVPRRPVRTSSPSRPRGVGRCGRDGLGGGAERRAGAHPVDARRGTGPRGPARTRRARRARPRRGAPAARPAPRPRHHRPALPAPALRWAAAARRHRHGGRRAPARPGARRTDDRAGRGHAGGRPRPRRATWAASSAWPCCS